MKLIISFVKNLAVTFVLIFSGCCIGSLAGFYVFFHGKIEADSWFVILSGISLISFVLSLFVSIARYLIGNKKIVDTMSLSLPLFGVFFICLVVFDPSSTVIFNRHVSRQQLNSLSGIQSSIDYEDNGNHVIRSRFNINQKDFDRILENEKYSLSKNDYSLEFPSIRELDWWQNNLSNLPLYMGLSVNDHT